MTNTIINNVASRLRAARSVGVLTGAGVSAESGVPTFRGPDGLWKKHRPEELATPQAFARDPALVWEWYDWRRQKVAACAPNAGHEALAELESRLGAVEIVTQNVDGLHRAAGSRRVWELHGCLWDVRCVSCGRATVDRRVPLPDLPPRCGCGGVLRPGVVWFGESLPPEPLEQGMEAARTSDVFLVVGTSAVVYPAAGLPVLAKQAGHYVVEVNPERTPLSSSVDAHLEGPSAEILPELMAAAFGVGSD